MVCDSTLGYGHEIVNHICILVATQGNGTLFPHDSFKEEDLVELCVGLELPICPSTSTQVRQYMTVRGRCPSGTQAQILGEEMVAWSPH